MLRVAVLLNLAGMVAYGIAALFSGNYGVASLLMLLAAPATWGIFVALGIAINRA